MPLTTCGFCYGRGEVTCPSCGGKGYFGRLTGGGEFDMSPCAVCAGRKRIRCQACLGRGQLGSPESPPFLPGAGTVRKENNSDVLEGRWNTSGGVYEFIKEKDGYRVTETSALGKSGEGRAVIQGNVVTLTVTNVFLGTFTVNLQLNDDTLEGALTVMGMPLPFVLSRE